MSFKGLSLSYKPIDKVFSKKEFFEFIDKYVGPMGRDIFEDITVKHAKEVSKLITVEGDNIKLSKKAVPHLALDGILYPFKILPGDMLNGAVEMLGKVPGLKTWANKIHEKPFFKNIRQRSKIDSKVNTLIGLITYKDAQLKSAQEAFAKKVGKTVKELTPEELDEDLTKQSPNSQIPKLEQQIAIPKLNFVLSSYYKGTGLEEVLKKLEEYLDNAPEEESDITNI